MLAFVIAPGRASDDTPWYDGSTTIEASSEGCAVREGTVFPSSLMTEFGPPTILVNTYPQFVERCSFQGFHLGPTGRVDCVYLEDDTVLARSDGEWRRLFDVPAVDEPDGAFTVRLRVTMRRCRVDLRFNGAPRVPAS